MEIHFTPGSLPKTPTPGPPRTRAYLATRRMALKTLNAGDPDATLAS